MGLPVKDLVVASNSNNVLTEFFENGAYDANREFFKTMSPSMDILVSSNLERLLFEFNGRDAKKTALLMNELKESGYYKVDEDELYEKLGEFFSYSSTEDDTIEVIDNFFDEYGYLADTHTAVAISALFKHINEAYDGVEVPCVVASTANPYKFPQSVYAAVSRLHEDDAEKAVKKLNFFTGMEIPEEILKLKDKPVLHTDVVKKEEIESKIFEIMNITSNE